jgi:deoxyribodipyrimidine photo-lyase
MVLLPPPSPGDERDWVTKHLGHLTCDRPEPSPRFRGTQAAADAALAAFDVTGYSRWRNEVLPAERRGASGLSPFIRHGLLPLPMVWDAVVDGPTADVAKFRDELLWQEYSRHLYARLGPLMAEPLRARRTDSRHIGSRGGDEPWNRSMLCIDRCIKELERDGWLVNQTRMWLASHWSIRHDADWNEGENRFFTHLLDGSRAANRAGWQWTVGTATGRPYGFARWQVEKRAPGLCHDCDHNQRCPIESFSDRSTETIVLIAPHPRLRRDADVAHTAGPRVVVATGSPSVVWLTAESLGDSDPALVANPRLPVVFIFDERLLARLQLSGKRLVFLAERLAELGQHRDLRVSLGSPADVVANENVATTFAPVPGWKRLQHVVRPVEVHPWLRPPGDGPLSSFGAWARSVHRT